jgi:hypothetical protein
MSVLTRSPHSLPALAALILVFKLWLSAVFPMTGDEAYFIYWGVFPDLGFYDHPPMVGWISQWLLHVSSAPWVLRLPVTVLPLAVGAMMWLALRRYDPERAALAALAFVLLPVNVWNVFITTDTPLVFFSFLSGLCFWKGVEQDKTRWFAFAGVFLGLAFLSKYFSALLGIAFLVYTAFAPPGQRNWRGLAVVFLGALPFGLLNLYWNYEHCWANLMFNVYNRHGDAGWSWKTPLLYLVCVLYVLSPPALWQILTKRGTAPRGRHGVAGRFFLCVWAVPFALFAGLSLVKTIGLHWLLSFVPFFFMSAAFLLSAQQLRRSVTYLATLSALHILAIVAVSFTPVETWKATRLYSGIVFHFRINDILARLDPYAADYVFMSDGYSAAVTASYYAGRRDPDGAKAGGDADALRRHYFGVFGTASSHARHDDILTDFRGLDGRNILVLRKTAPEQGDYERFFRSVAVTSFTEAGATYYIVLGRGFSYPTYRAQVLEPMRRRYYAIPAYLPQGHCYFCERYFESATCEPVERR